MLKTMKSTLWRDRVFHFLFINQAKIELKDLVYLAGPPPSSGECELKGLLEKDFRIESEDGYWSCKPLAYFHENRDFADVEFVITDIETTGPFPDKEDIIEIAAVKVKEGRIVDRYETLVHTDRKIPYHIGRITGISNGMLEGTPSLDKVLAEFRDFLGRGIFCAHNAEFDFLFLNGVFNSRNDRFLHGKLPFCTLRMAQKMLPSVKACGITSLSRHFGLEVNNRHRAMGDVLATKSIFDVLVEKLREKKKRIGLHELFEIQLDFISGETVERMVNRKKKKRSKKNGNEPRQSRKDARKPCQNPEKVR